MVRHMNETTARRMVVTAEKVKTCLTDHVTGRHRNIAVKAQIIGTRPLLIGHTIYQTGLTGTDVRRSLPPVPFGMWWEDKWRRHKSVFYLEAIAGMAKSDIVRLAPSQMDGAGAGADVRKRRLLDLVEIGIIRFVAKGRGKAPTVKIDR